MLKLLGAALVLLAAIMFPRLMQADGKAKADGLERVILLIKYIRDQIDLYALPIDKILFSCPDLEIDSLEKLTDVADLDEESRQIVAALAVSFGKGDRDSQVKLCGSTVKKLEEHKCRIEEELPKKQKTLSALCLCIGGMLLIMLM